MGKKDLQKKRIWEIDALRGYVILWVLIHHLYTAVYDFLINGGYTSVNPAEFVSLIDPNYFFFRLTDTNRIEKAAFYSFMEFYRIPFVNILFIVSGISTHFSNNGLKSGIRLLCGAAFVSLFTKLLVLWTGDESQFIRFGVLHCYAMCHMIHYFLLEDRSDKVLLAVAVASMIVGYYLRHNPVYTNSALLVPFGIRENDAILRDYWPVFPMLGWFLIGVLMGKRFYPEKKTLFPGLEAKKWHRPLCFLGRHSGLIYCGHMVVYTLVFWSIGHIFNLY